MCIYIFFLTCITEFSLIRTMRKKIDVFFFRLWRRKQMFLPKRSVVVISEPVMGDGLSLFCNLILFSLWQGENAERAQAVIHCGSETYVFPQREPMFVFLIHPLVSLIKCTQHTLGVVLQHERWRFVHKVTLAVRHATPRRTPQDDHVTSLKHALMFMMYSTRISRVRLWAGTRAEQCVTLNVDGN